MRLCHHRGFAVPSLVGTTPDGYGGTSSLVRKVTTLNKPACSAAYPEALFGNQSFSQSIPSPSRLKQFRILFGSFFAGQFAFSILCSMEPLENPESLMKVMRKWERDDEDDSDFMTILDGSMLLLTGGQDDVGILQLRR